MDITLRLIDGVAPSGEIRAIDLEKIAGALHQMSIRLGRELDKSTRPGRSRPPVEELHQVRVVGLTNGSTVLDFRVGPPEMLPIEFEDEQWRDEQLRSLLTGLADDSRPEGVSDLVADSVAELVQGLRTAASTVEVSGSGLPTRRFSTSALHRDSWVTPRRAAHDETATLAGILEKIDIHSHELRLRDDVDNALDLIDVEHDVRAAALGGRRVQATGRALRARDGSLCGLLAPELTEFRSAIAMTSPPSLEEQLATLPGPDPESGIELSDEEFQRFMAAIGR